MELLTGQIYSQWALYKRRIAKTQTECYRAQVETTITEAQAQIGVSEMMETTIREQLAQIEASLW